MLTAQQQRVLSAITRHWQTHACGPSVRDLCATLDISSPNGIVCHLKALERKGCIETRQGTMSRALWPAGLRERIQKAAKELTS